MAASHYLFIFHNWCLLVIHLVFSTFLILSFEKFWIITRTKVGYSKCTLKFEVSNELAHTLDQEGKTSTYATGSVGQEFYLFGRIWSHKGKC